MGGVTGPAIQPASPGMHFSARPFGSAPRHSAWSNRVEALWRPGVGIGLPSWSAPPRERAQSAPPEALPTRSGRPPRSFPENVRRADRVRRVTSSISSAHPPTAPSMWRMKITTSAAGPCRATRRSLTLGRKNDDEPIESAQRLCWAPLLPSRPFQRQRRARVWGAWRLQTSPRSRQSRFPEARSSPPTRQGLSPRLRCPMHPRQ